MPSAKVFEEISAQGSINCGQAEYDAIVLAAAGIRRQGIDNDSDFCLRVSFCKGDASGGRSGSDCDGDKKKGTLANELAEKFRMFIQQVSATERAVLTKLNAGCHEPIGVLCTLDGHRMNLSLMEEKEGEVIRRSVQGDRGDWQNLVEKIVSGEEIIVWFI